MNPKKTKHSTWTGGLFTGIIFGLLGGLVASIGAQKLEISSSSVSRFFKQNKTVDGYATINAKKAWGYCKNNGPLLWGTLPFSKNNTQCATGLRQSPIDISTSDIYKDASIGSIVFNYKPGGKEVKVEEKGIKVEYLPDNPETTLSGGTVRFHGATYQLIQFHWHSPSEHTLNGKASLMEIHFVHEKQATPTDPGGELLVVGVLYDAGKKNNPISSLLQDFVFDAPNEIIEINNKTKYLNAKNFLPDTLQLNPDPQDGTMTTSHYYTYSGSLTTPGCHEGVTWIVLKDKNSLTENQREDYLGILSERACGTARNTQPLNGRKVSSPLL